MSLSTPAAVIAVACLLPCGASALAAPTFAPVEGGRVAYESCGAGPKAVVLLHDGFLDSAAYDAAWPKLCARFKVVRYDRRGYGNSPPATAPYDAVTDLGAVMQAAGVAHATVVGASAGGGVAVDFALAHPQAVDRLVLVGATVTGFRPTTHFIKRTTNLVALLAQGRFAEAARDPYILTQAAEAQRAFAIADLTAHPGNIRAGAMIKGGAPMSRLGEINAPTLILTGEADIADVHAQAGALEALIPKAQRDVIAGAGHFVYLERPDEFAAAITKFVEGDNPDR